MSTPQPNTELLKQSLLPNYVFHTLIELEAQETQWGTITFNVMLKGGVAQLETLNIVKNKRKRY
jgi:hypothetical protein